MHDTIPLPMPRFLPPLDPDFRPASLAIRAFQNLVRESGPGIPLVIALERPDGSVSRYETRILTEKHPAASANLPYAERICKFLLWQKGASKILIAGPAPVADHVRQCYSPGGTRSFDFHFMGDEVYGKPFSVVLVKPEEIPPEKENSYSLGRNLEGCRVGFDLGASDRKAAAVIDGVPVYSEEVIWEPKKQSNPDYHYREILSAIEKAAKNMPRLDAIGGSAAGIYINNEVRISSLFRGVPKDCYHQVRSLFSRIREHFNVPLEVINDGDVTALAGSMSIEDNGVLGIALGSSLAAGYVTAKGHITGWLNELAFAPIDCNPHAPQEEWSGDRGCGALYLSQQCVFRHADKVGIQTVPAMPDVEKLKHVQQALEKGHPGARKIWHSMGIYLGYAVALYNFFYDLKHILILGRCTSGKGGEIILKKATAVLNSEFPEIAARISLQLPNEKNRRIGQAVAAASLPILCQEEKPR